MNDYRGNEPEKIDLSRMTKDVLQGLRRLWLLLIIIVLGFASKEYFIVSRNYQPKYIASATMSVRCIGNDEDFVNRETAELMAEVFPYILKSGILQKEIANEMKLDDMPGSISMTSEEGTNLFTITAQADEPQLSYDLLQATLKQYPEVAKIVIGEIEMNILDETGIPKDSGKEQMLRGSVKKGILEGILVGCVILVIYALTRTTIKNRKELKRVLNLADFGSIPYVPAKKRKSGKFSSVNLNSEQVPQVYLEAIRKLRIKVMKEIEENQYSSILVTSSIPGEGKTTVAMNLAIALARQGKNVILVDCDPRNPSVAKNMKEHGNYPGIGAVLRKEIAVKDALCEVPMESGKLQIMYGAKPDAKAAQMLGSEKMKRVMQELEAMAEIVILDTAPAELLADATTLAKNVDTAIYVVKCDCAKQARIRNGVSALSVSGIKILGYVFNGDKNRRSGNYGYKRYGYGYGYGYYGSRKKDELAGRVIKD